MAVLEWDKVGQRTFENGLDKGVLYLSDGRAVAWNGLTSIVEKFNNDQTEVYYDGMKISDLLSMGDFAATIKAITYPDDFLELDGHGFLRRGVFLENQPPRTFSLSYRTYLGNDVDGNSAGYKIHIIYNVTAIPNNRTYNTFGENVDTVEFEWDITCVPQEAAGFRPTGHISFNSLSLEPDLLKFIEDILYGTETTEPNLISISDLISYMYSWARMEIIDHGDGTWTANCMFDEDLVFDTIDPTFFTLNNANVIYLNSEMYNISNTMNTSEA